mmetsp:Transcript_39312/g.98407  ORF Transcript_39312/g.98407 Transcript_39312/m.98407 type:complete len:234 (-) Transcript_39312:537-1238(-)
MHIFHPSSRHNPGPHGSPFKILSRSAILVLVRLCSHSGTQLWPGGGANCTRPHLAIPADDKDAEQLVERLGVDVCALLLVLLLHLGLFGQQPILPRLSTLWPSKERVPHPVGAAVLHRLPSSRVIVEVCEEGHEQHVVLFEFVPHPGGKIYRAGHLRCRSRQKHGPVGALQLLQRRHSAIGHLHLERRQLVLDPRVLLKHLHVGLSTLVLPDPEPNPGGHHTEIDGHVWHRLL